MAYRVKIFPRAERDLASIYHSINAQNSGVALVWYLGLRDAIRSLRNTPSRCPVTPEEKEFRHLLYGARPYVYRVIFRVMERPKVVDILHVRHGARQGFKIAGLQ